MVTTLRSGKTPLQPHELQQSQRSSRPASSRRLTNFMQHRLLALLLFSVWLLPVLGGVLLNEGTQTHAELAADKVSLPLDSFDWLLRQGGALLPLLPLLLRWASRREPLRAVLGPEVLLYAGLSIIRSVVYRLHVSGAFEWLLHRGVVSAAPVEYMSDHIFLGGSLTAILACEVLQGTAELDDGRQLALRWPAATGVSLASLLYLLVAGDAFYTARYFHGAGESLLAALCATSFFSLPAAVFSLWSYDGPRQHPEQHLT